MGPFDRDLLEHARAIRSGSLEAVELLTRLITLSGLCMSLSHASTPASGFEHVLSHVLDLQNELEGRPLPAHGSQAALAAVLGARTYQIFIKEFDPASVRIEDCFPEVEMMRQEILGVFAAIDPSGKAGEECWSDYRVKLEAWRAKPDRVTQFLRNWPEIKGKLQDQSRSPQQLQAILSAAACPQSFAELQPAISAGQVRFAYLNAALMRRRLTIGDALVFFGWDREHLWQRVWKEAPVKPNANLQ
jgi:glycerol-1-phosphate dehydrogenase [NAD(P)+]